MNVPSPIKAFARELQSISHRPTVYNFYHAKRTNRQRANLEYYLTWMHHHPPKLILVGEAPGYNGCRRTGIPFTTETILYQGALNGQLFGVQGPFHKEPIPTPKEQSAKALWEVLEAMQCAPLVWNIFPFHPHYLGQPNTNRKPIQSEITEGFYYLQRLLELFPAIPLVSVGTVADRALLNAKYPHEHLRHPSFGGKRAFQEGLRHLLTCYQ